MFKLLYGTDFHVTMTKPSCRKDDYFGSIMSKMNQIDQIARKENVDVILGGGDLCQKPVEDNRVFKELYSYFKNSFIRWDMIAGLTHDFGSVFSVGYPKSILSCLEHTGVIKVHGEEWLFYMDGIRIYSGHQSITENGFFGHHILYKDFNKPADLVLTSHIHSPFPERTVNGIRFVAPGSIARNSVDLYNHNRKPQVVLVCVSDGKIDKIEYIPLEVNLDIFDEKYLIQKENNELQRETSSFEGIQELVGSETFVDPESIIKKIGERFSGEVVDEAMKFKGLVENG